ncbi:MAG TPA: hypothetical protein VEJ23_06425 [Solirubrobacteraceae bacterium]|nr:hypothetical protein [Solirubrobacteraceae bacterium]
MDSIAGSFPEALDYFPAAAEEDAGPRRYLGLPAHAHVDRAAAR